MKRPLPITDQYPQFSSFTLRSMLIMNQVTPVGFLYCSFAILPNYDSAKLK